MLLYQEDKSGYLFKIGCREYTVFAIGKTVRFGMREEGYYATLTEEETQQAIDLFSSMRTALAAAQSPVTTTNANFSVITGSLYNVTFSPYHVYRFTLNPGQPAFSVLDTRYSSREGYTIDDALLVKIIGCFSSALADSKSDDTPKEVKGIITLSRSGDDKYWTATLMGDPTMSCRSGNRAEALSGCILNHGHKVNITLDQASVVTEEVKEEGPGGDEESA